MSCYDNQYLYEIRQRVVNVYKDFVSGKDFDDQYIGINHIRYEVCHKDESLKIHAINEKQLRALGYFLYTFTPEKVLTLINDVLKADETIKGLNEKVGALEKEADWLAEKASECAKGKCWKECPVSCEGKDAAQAFRNAARKAVD